MRISALALAAAVLCACGRRAGFSVPDLDDAPVLARAASADLPERAPVYGVALKNGDIEVNVEAADAGRVKPGQDAVAYATPARSPFPCRVTRVLPRASAETGQALAWLTPLGRSLAAPNDFVAADVTVAVRRGALVVPKTALLVREGKTYVVRAAKGEDGRTSYVPAPVETGADSADAVEITSGLKAGDQVVVRGAAGYLYPDFKAGAAE